MTAVIGRLRVKALYIKSVNAYEEFLNKNIKNE